MKKHTRFAMSLLLLLGILMAFASAQAVEPRYTGITRLTSSLEISASGAASCAGKAILRSGYTADLKVELKRDGSTIKTWTTSGSDTLSAGGTYYVMSGHDYVVTTTATVYDSTGKLVESPSANSVEHTY